MRAAVLITALLLSSTAAAQSQYGSRYTEPTEPIVVTGIRIQDYRDRLAACLARNCPVNEDVDATMALAEALMLSGAYGDARASVHASLRRNRDQARQFPEPVSDLYRAHSRLSRHTGFDRDGLVSANGILSALEAGIPREDHRHFTARFEIAEIQLLSGYFDEAQRSLERLARLARRAGREDVAVMAELRRLLYADMAAPQGTARARLEELSRLTDPARQREAVGAKAVLARIYRSEGNHARADALLAGIARGNSARRRLVHSPRYELIGSAHTNIRQAENFNGKWIDVGFWVSPDGRVSDLEITRSGGDPVWANSLLNSIRARLYSTASEPTYRLERYTLTAGREQPTGTRLMQQMSDEARVEYLDLTVGNPPPPPGAPAAAGPET